MFRQLIRFIGLTLFVVAVSLRFTEDSYIPKVFNAFEMQMKTRLEKLMADRLEFVENAWKECKVKVPTDRESGSNFLLLSSLKYAKSSNNDDATNADSNGHTETEEERAERKRKKKEKKDFKKLSATQSSVDSVLPSTNTTSTNNSSPLCSASDFIDDVFASASTLSTSKFSSKRSHNDTTEHMEVDTDSKIEREETEEERKERKRQKKEKKEAKRKDNLKEAANNS